MLLIVVGVLVVGLGVNVCSRRPTGTGRAATLGRVNNLASGVVVGLIGLGFVALGIVELL